MSNRVTELLGCQYPVIQAAMSYISTAELAAAVCKAGGMGVIGTNPGVLVNTRDARETGEIIRREIIRLRGLTDRPFAVNYVIARDEHDPSIIYANAVRDVILEEKVPFVVMACSMSDYVQREIRNMAEHGVKVMYREVSCTLDACLKAREAGAAALIVTGVESGGHVSDYNMSLMDILPLVTDEITDIPVIAAGSIVGTKTARAARALGAEGAYCGTAFLVAEECPTHEKFKQLILDAKGEDTIMWRASMARMMTNSNYVGRICSALDRGGAERREIRPHYAGSFGKAMLQGDIERSCVTFAPSVGAITAIRPAAAIVADIAAGFGG